MMIRSVAALAVIGLLVAITLPSAALRPYREIRRPIQAQQQPTYKNAGETKAAPSLGTGSPIPPHMMLFFDSPQCPQGWEEVSSTQGRMIVSVGESSVAGVTVNNPLKDKEDRAHNHSASAKLNLGSHHIAAIDCCNDQGAAQGVYDWSTTSTSSASGLPFTQLILCRFRAGARESNYHVPFGTVAYFDTNVDQCPTNWVPMQEANGRFIVPGYAEGGAMPSAAPALQSGEDRKHGHFFDFSFETTSVEYAGVDGCCNDNVAGAGSVVVSSTTEPSSLGLPYMQLLTCVNNEPSFNTTLPDNAMLFVEEVCPPGWELADEVGGRFLVSLPEGGLAAASFGANSLKPLGQSEPTHDHTLSESFTPPSQGVGLATGCCADGYAAAQQYAIAGPTKSHSADVPYIMMPMCRKSA